MGESIWFALTSITPQGGGECPKALSGRVLVAAYWLFIVLMLATFTANLAAFLTVERYVYGFWSSQTLFFVDIELGKRNHFLSKNLTDMNSLTEAVCFYYQESD